MSFLVTVHLDNRLRAHQGAGSAAGARLFRITLGIGIALCIEPWRNPDAAFGTKRDAQVAAFAFFVMNTYFSLHGSARIIKLIIISAIIRIRQ